MSIVRAVSVFCSACGDHHEHPCMNVTDSLARASAARAGWGRVRHENRYVDLCPKCLEKRKPRQEKS